MDLCILLFPLRSALYFLSHKNIESNINFYTPSIITIANWLSVR